MLNYYEQYHITNGIFYAFSTKAKKRILSTSHSEKKIESFKSRFPYHKYESFTKENFIVLNLYINFKQSPSSVEDVLRHLQDTNFNEEVLGFKKKITQYRELLSAHIEYLMSTYGKPSIQEIFDAYRKKKIEFYTLWFYLYYLGYDLYSDIEELKVFSRVQVRELQKIKQLLLYVTFSEKSLVYIKMLLQQSDLIQEQVN